MAMPGSRLESDSLPTGKRPHRFAWPMAALALVLIGCAGVVVVAAPPTSAAEPTVSPFTAGRHVYDYGELLSAKSVKTAEALAANVEAAGGGRIVLYTAGDASNIPFTLAQDWHVDGLLLTGEGDYGIITVGATLKGKLGAHAGLLSNPPPGEPTIESWMLTTLARAEGLLNDNHVFDGAGVLDSNGRQHAEAAAKALATKLGEPVYVDISLGAPGGSNGASYNSSILGIYLGKSLVVALTVTDGQVSGQIASDASLLYGYHTGTPWVGDSMASEAAAGGDVQAALLTAIDAVQNGPIPKLGNTGGGIDWELIFWIVFAVVMVGIGVGSPFYGSWLIRKISGVSAPIKGGLPGDAIIESITDTGTTVSMPSVGPEAPEYKFGLQVTPAGGGAAYKVETKAFVPRLYIPMVVPGASVGVMIDPTDPQKVTLDFSRMGGASAGAVAAPVVGPGGMDFQFDADGRPTDGEVSTLVGAVRGGTLPTINGGSAEQLLATGTHGTAVITTAMPLGKTVRDINPAADPSRLNDPVWIFTVEATLPGQAPFPAVFGHRVPIAKLAYVAPGVKLAVAVNEANKNQEVAIDWDQSPIA